MRTADKFQGLLDAAYNLGFSKDKMITLSVEDDQTRHYMLGAKLELKMSLAELEMFIP